MGNQTETELEQLHPVLRQMRSSAVQRPRGSVEGVLAEAAELRASLAQTAVEAALARVGAASDSAVRLDTARGALRGAQQRWLSAAAMGKSADQFDAEQQGGALREEMSMAADYHLRGRQQAAALARITHSEDPYDLMQDLTELADLIEEFPEAFAADQSFDGPGCAARARSICSRIWVDAPDEEARQEAKDLRDRAFSHLSAVMAELRQAGYYALRASPRYRALFASTQRSQRRPSELPSMIHARIA